MSILHIKIVELKCPESRNVVNYFYAQFSVENELLVDFRLQIDPMNRHTEVLSSGTKKLSIGVKQIKESKLTIILKRHRMLISDDEIGRVTIPLNWFPKNKVVREWFPIAASGRVRSTLADSIKKLSAQDQPSKSASARAAKLSTVDPDGSEKIMLLLDVHIVSKSRIIAPFAAPFAPLKVTPGWIRPSILENSEFPPLPPICYVTSGEPISSVQKEIPPYQPYEFMNNNLLTTDAVQNQVAATSHTSSNEHRPSTSNEHIPSTSNERRQSTSNPPPIVQVAPEPQQQQQNSQQHIQDTNPPMVTAEDTPEVIEQYPDTMFRPYFAAPQPNFTPLQTEPEGNVLPPFMGGNLDAEPASIRPNGIPVVAGIQSPYAHAQIGEDVFRSSEVPNVYYPQVSIMDDEYDDDEPENQDQPGMISNPQDQ